MIRLLLLVLIFSSFLWGQTQSILYIPSASEQGQKKTNALDLMYQKRSLIDNIPVTQVLEAELESSNYRVGPGDTFKFIFFDQTGTSFKFTISPEGNVMIPTVGAFHLSGMTLQKAKETLNKEVAKFYDREQFAINLDQLRKFRVYLTGEVRAPGTYFVQGSDRLADVLEASIIQSLSSKEASSSLTDWADNSRIEIRHKDSTVSIIDISSFYKEGKEEQNPYLQGGDIIFVPSIDLSKDYVVIEGNIGFQGLYALKKNETLFAFLTRVSALSKKSNLQNIVLVRDGRRQVLDILNQEDIRNSFLLQKGDKIIIPTIYENVYVRGEVRRPGAFPYKANYTAKDYIGEAGAMDSADDMESIIVLRQGGDEIALGPDIIIHKGDTIILPRRAREVFKDYIRILLPILSLGISVYSIVTR